jgi:hypothetical protein
MVARVSKFDVYEVPVGFALIACASRSGPNPDTGPLRLPRAAMPCAVDPLRGLSNKRMPSLKLDRCNDDCASPFGDSGPRVLHRHPEPADFGSD